MRSVVLHDKAALAALKDLRESLLRLHKNLLEVEKASFERDHAKIQSPQHFLQLLTGDPRFAWLRPLSGMIVYIDEVEEGSITIDNKVLEGICLRIRTLLSSESVEGGFYARYSVVLNSEPDILFEHVQLTRALGRVLAK